MSFKVNATGILAELEAGEEERLRMAENALAALRSKDVRGLTGPAASVAASNKEMASTIMARAGGEGPSVTGLATQQTLGRIQPQQTGSALGDYAAQQQAAQQMSQVAAQGALQRGQESVQLNQLGLDMGQVSRAVQNARQQRQQDLALAIAQIGMDKDVNAAGRAVREENARLGIQTERYIQSSRQRDQNLRTGLGAAFTIGGTLLSSQAGKTPKAPTAPSVPKTQAPGVTSVPKPLPGTEVI